MHRPSRSPGRLTSVGLVLSLALAVVILVPGTASACSCDVPPPPSEALADADAVFLGTVVETRQQGRGIDGELIARMAIEEVWKGEVAEVVEVRTPADDGLCGYGFAAGDRDLVYARQGDDGSFSMHTCTRSAPVDMADEDLAAFGEGQEPVAGEQLAQDGPSLLVLSLAGLAVMVAVGLAVAGIAWRRRHPSRP